jgi:hypothetical protein
MERASNVSQDQDRLRRDAQNVVLALFIKRASLLTAISIDKSDCPIRSDPQPERRQQLEGAYTEDPVGKGNRPKNRGQKENIQKTSYLRKRVIHCI